MKVRQNYLPASITGLLIPVMLAAAPPDAVAEDPPLARKYADEDYHFNLGVPEGWKSLDPSVIRVTGELRRAWSPQPPSVICVFVQKFPRPASDARQVVDREAKLVNEALHADVKKQEIREMAGMKAGSLIYVGKGTGGSVNGKGNVPTYKHRVWIPRGNEIIVLDLVTPEQKSSEHSKVFDAMLKSLQIEGKQTEEQAAAK